jgi:hypothetical protein
MLKLATDATPPSGWKPTFVGAPAAGLRGLRAENSTTLVAQGAKLRRWVQRTSGGLKVIDLTKFDVIVIYGLGLRSRDGLIALTEFQPATVRFDDTSRLISESAFSALLASGFSRSTAMHVLNLVKGCGKPIILAPAPLPNENLLSRPNFDWMKTKEGQRAAAWATEVARRNWRAMAQDAGVSLLLQPEDTIVGGCLTRKKYAVGASRLSGRDYNDDPTHLNPQFGKCVLDDISSMLPQDNRKTSGASRPRRDLRRMLRKSFKKVRRFFAPKPDKALKPRH